MTPRRRSASFIPAASLDADEDEVRNGGTCGLEAMLAEHVREQVIAWRFERATPLDLRRAVEACQRSLLPDRGHVERTAHLADRRDDILRTDPVADAEPGETEDLRERPEDEDPMARLQVLRDRRPDSSGSSMYSKYAWSSTVRTCGEPREVRVELGPAVRRACRIVRRRDEDELRPRRDRSEERIEVDSLVAQGHAHRDRAELERVEHVARERGPARDDLVPGIERRLARRSRRPRLRPRRR